MKQLGEIPGPVAAGRSPIYKDLILLQLAALVFLLDQFTKFLVLEFLPFRHSFPEEGLFRLTHTQNTGSAFGLLQGQNAPLILVAIVGITVLVFIYSIQRRPDNLLRFSLGLQLGGAAGNLLDRLRLGHVTDFLDVGAWPVFNLADSSIVVGLVLLAWLLLGPQHRAGRGVAAEAVSEAGTMAGGDRAPVSWCPVCDGEMLVVSRGWRCSTCGVRERVEEAGAGRACGTIHER